eukprot:5686222-Amphidinium_carterae.1
MAVLMSVVRFELNFMKTNCAASQKDVSTVQMESQKSESHAITRLEHFKVWCSTLGMTESKTLQWECPFPMFCEEMNVALAVKDLR